MSQWGTLSCWENSIIQHKTSQWSHFSFHSRIILGLCEKLPVEKRDLTTGKLNIKPSARATVFTSDLYVNTQTHIEYIEQNILDKKVSRGKNNYQTSCTMLSTLLSKPPKCYMKSWFHCIAMYCMTLAWPGRRSQTVRQQGVPKSTSIHGSTRREPGTEVLSTSPARIPQIIAPPPHPQRNPAPALCFNIWYPANPASSCQPAFPTWGFSSNSLFSVGPSLLKVVQKVLVWYTSAVQVILTQHQQQQISVFDKQGNLCVS